MFSQKRKREFEDYEKRKRREALMLVKHGEIITDPEKLKKWNEIERERENERYIEKHASKIKKREKASRLAQTQNFAMTHEAHSTFPMVGYPNPTYPQDNPRVIEKLPWMKKDKINEILRGGEFLEAWPFDTEDPHNNAETLNDRWINENMKWARNDRASGAPKVIMKRKLKYKKTK